MASRALISHFLSSLAHVAAFIYFFLQPLRVGKDGLGRPSQVWFPALMGRKLDRRQVRWRREWGRL